MKKQVWVFALNEDDESWTGPFDSRDAAIEEAKAIHGDSFAIAKAEPEFFKMPSVRDVGEFIMSHFENDCSEMGADEATKFIEKYGDDLHKRFEYALNSWARKNNIVFNSSTIIIETIEKFGDDEQTSLRARPDKSIPKSFGPMET